MTRIQRILTAMAITTVAAHVGIGCNGRPSTSSPRPPAHQLVQHTTLDTGPMVPARVTMHAHAVQGTLEAETSGGQFQPVDVDRSIDEVRAIRSTGKGAVLTIEDEGGISRAQLWLRGGTLVHLFDTGGDLVIELARGSARIRATHLPAYAALDQGNEAIAGRDVMLYRPTSDSPLTFAPTHHANGSAGWTMDLEGEAAPASLGVLEVRPGDGDERAYLTLRRVHVEAESAGDYAYTQVEHVFYNPTDSQLEGTFRFHLPEGAMPLGLATMPVT